jgi:hypothetical protein
MTLNSKPRLRLENGKWKCGRMYFVDGTYFGVRSTTGVGNTPEEAYMDWLRRVAHE